MKILLNFLKNYDQFFGIIFIVVVIYIYINHKKGSIEKDGRITIAKVTKFDAAESGVLLFLEIQFHNKKYETYVDVWCKKCVGKYFFVKVSKDDPKSYPIFYESNPVPECILSKPLPTEGWEEIPVCNDDK